MLSPTELRRREASPLWESNPRPRPYHGSALPTELRGRQSEPTESSARDSLGAKSRYVFCVHVATRFALVSDAERICDIYNHEVVSGLNTLDLEERSLSDQISWINNRSGAHMVLVATLGPRVIGFSAISPYRDRAAYRTTVESSVYVAEDAQGHGVGTVLMRDLVHHTTLAGFHSMIARIQSTNAASRRLHETLGFRHVGTEIAVGRKFGKWVDMSTYQLLLETR
jgi:L-amino acid N-acyltransferase YncA